MKLEAYLAKHGIKMSEFAEQIGVDPTAVSRWCSGKRTPLVGQLLKIDYVTKGQVSLRDFDSGDQ